MANLFMMILAIVGTIISYTMARKLYARVTTPLFLPIIVAVVIIVTVLTLGNISYEVYMKGGQWIHALLGPAVVALAYPLYEQRALLKRLAIPVLIGSLVGAIIGLFSGFILAKFVRLDDELVYSLLPKSVTTPVAMDISESLGGIGSLAAVLVIIAGLTGVILGPFMFRLFGLQGDLAQGVGLGSASHAIGTASAFEKSELAGSISTIAMIVSAVFVSFLTPILIHFLM